MQILSFAVIALANKQTNTYNGCCAMATVQWLLSNGCCPMATVQWLLCNGCCAMATVQWLLCNGCCAMAAVQWLLCNGYCEWLLCNGSCAMAAVQWLLCNGYCAMATVQWLLYNGCCAMATVQWLLYNGCCTMAAVQWLLYIHVLGLGRLISYRKDPLKNTMLRGLARKVCKGAVVVSYLLKPKQILLPHKYTVHSHDLAFLAATLPDPLLEAIFIFRELPAAIFLVGEVGRLMRSGDTSRSKLFRGLLSSSPSFISTRSDSCSSHSSGWGGSDLVPLSTGCLLVSLPHSLPL